MQLVWKLFILRKNDFKEISLPQPNDYKNLENAKNVEIDEATQVRFGSMIIGKVGCFDNT